jgi:hypothetical protein
VVLEEKFFIFSFPELILEESVDCGPGAILAFSQDPQNQVIAWPDKKKGFFKVHIYNKKKKVVEKAHET